MFAKCRPNDVYRCAKITLAVFKQRLKLGPIPISPTVWIQARKQARQKAIHDASSLRKPARVKCCRVFNLARSTPKPSAVIR